MSKRPGIVIVAGGSRVQGVELDFAIEHFAERLRKRGKAANTIKAYVADVVSLQAYLVTRGITLVGLIAQRELEGWLDSLDAAGQCRRTQARRLTAVRKLLGHCRTEGWMRRDYEPERDVHVSFRARRVTSPEMADLIKMVEAIKVTGSDAHANVVALRDRAMLRLALDSGLRATELVQLDVPADAHTQYTVDLKRLLVQVQAKGGDDETVAIDPTTVRMVEQWLTVRSKMVRDDCPALFVTNRGGRFTRQALYDMVVRRAAAAGLGHVHPHLLRHRRIGDIYEACGPKVAQDHARHAHQSTTENVYGRHAAKVSHQVVRAMCPLPTGGQQS